MEEHSARHTNWLDATIDTLSIDFLDTSAIHVHKPEAGCEEPDMIERRSGKLTTPFCGNENTTQGGGDNVTEPLP